MPPRKNASSGSRGSPARARIIMQIHRTGGNERKEFADYGERCNGEIYFSGLKRTVEEVIKANGPDYIAQEIATKMHYYNILRKMTHVY